MARLLADPGFGLAALTPISGPNARNSGSNTASDGTEQTFVGVGDVWAFRFDFPHLQGVAARRQRGVLNSALLSGANAKRWTVVDGDRLKPAEAGVVEPYHAQAWGNGELWANGQPWAATYPNVRVAAAAAVDTGIISLTNTFWGRKLGIGDWLGFFPFHFGLYEISEVIGQGKYRIWPRLRKALSANDFATLHPTIVLKLTGQGAARLRRGPFYTEGQGADLVEVIDPYVRQYFTD